MNNPFWLNLIKQWREKGMGHYGVSFPFLVGATAKQSGRKITLEYIRGLFQEMINNPVQDYYCEVRWCGDIEESVISVEKNDTIKFKAIKAYFTDEKGQTSLAFTEDLMSMFNLNCSSKEECLEKLISGTLENIEKGFFQKTWGFSVSLHLRILSSSRMSLVAFYPMELITSYYCVFRIRR